MRFLPFFIGSKRNMKAFPHARPYKKPHAFCKENMGHTFTHGTRCGA